MNPSTKVNTLDEAILWLKQSKRYLKSAESQLQSYPETAYYLALMAGEFSLKAILNKIGLFEKRDQHHDMLKLCEKITQHVSLNNRIVDLVKELGYVNLTHRVTHADSPSGMTSQIRYPYENVPPYILIRVEDAQKKIKLVKELISKIEEGWNKLKL